MTLKKQLCFVLPLTVCKIKTIQDPSPFRHTSDNFNYLAEAAYSRVDIMLKVSKMNNDVTQISCNLLVCKKVETVTTQKHLHQFSL